MNIKSFLVLLHCSVVLFGCGSDLENQELLQLGKENFTPQAWKSAPDEERGAMMHSFFKQHDIDTMTLSEVLQLLGQPTRYYDYDHIPAYALGGSVKSEYGSGYMMVFIPNKNGLIIDHYVVPKIVK